MDIAHEEHMIQKLDAPWRKDTLPPEKTLLRLGLAAGQTMADIGCGIGYLALPACRIVGGGKVYAIDLSKRMLEETARRAEAEGLKNIVLADTDGKTFLIEDNSVDFAVTCNVLHEVEDREGFIAEIARITKPGGSVCIIEWIKREMPFGPDVAERLSMGETAALLKKAKLAELEMYLLGALHYGVKATKR